MGAWHKSSWYGSSWYNSTWYGGSGGGGASVATGGGSAVSLALPAAWREVTAKELRASAERAHARERAKRFASLREGLHEAQRREENAPKAPEKPALREPSTITDAILVGRDGPVDALTRMLAKWDEDREREEAMLARDARRSTVTMKSRRAVVTEFGVRRAVVRKFSPDQPRAEDGRFGEGSGGSGTGRSTTQGLKTRSGNDVTFRSFSDDQEKTTAETVNKTLRAIGVAGATLDDIPSLIGATPDATIRINADAGDASIRVSAKGNGYEMSRIISKDKDGKIVISNESFEIDEDSRGKGLGTSVFASQVDAAARIGVDRIETIAAGQKGGEQNGYYTWARLGYDGEIPSSVKGRPPGHEQAMRVSELMGSKEGRDWWKNNGQTFNGSFSLKGSSTSRQALSGYMEGKTASGVRKAQGGSDADVLTEEDEEILDEVWKQIAEQRKLTPVSQGK